MLFLLSCFVVATLAFPLELEVAKNTPENEFRLRHLQEHDLAEELSGQFEGDILLTQQQAQELQKRNGIRASAVRWPNKTVPYEISGDFTDDQKRYIRKALDTLESSTCLQFVPRTGQKDFVDVVSSGSGCNSAVGRLGGRQQMNLQPYPVEQGCFRMATIMHEFIHAIGFFHMQSTYDRNNYVEIKWENIEFGQEHNFLKYERFMLNDYDQEYDYESVMHYGRFGFSKNGEPTIVPLDPEANIGQRVGLSYSDVLKINKMYECEV